MEREDEANAYLGANRHPKSLAKRFYFGESGDEPLKTLSDSQIYVVAGTSAGLARMEDSPDDGLALDVSKSRRGHP